MGHNPHHWEYWIDFASDGSIIAKKMPYKYVVEMICDWVGAGMVYSGKKWTKEEPMNYYYKVRNGRHFHPDTEKLILTFLSAIKEGGLEQFHKAARSQAGYSYLYVDYVGIFCP